LPKAELRIRLLEFLGNFMRLCHPQYFVGEREEDMLFLVCVFGEQIDDLASTRNEFILLIGKERELRFLDQAAFFIVLH
jgi:hypothetical protein